MALLLGLPAALACREPGSGRSTADAGSPAPDFRSRDLTGQAVALADYRGTVVLLNVWATWCDPCMRELPELARLHEQLGARGFTVVGLNADVRSKQGAVRNTVDRYELPFPIWLDPEGKAQVAFKLNGYPTSVLVDRAGTIRWRREGEILRNDPELIQRLETLLAEPAS